MDRGRGFPVVAVGGTFDIIHKGHIALLTRAFEIGDKVVIGVSTDELLPRLRKKHPVRPYTERVEGLKKYLSDRGWVRRAVIAPLTDKYGPTVLTSEVQAIVVTPDTVDSAREINQIRKSRGLPPLHVNILDLVLGEDGLPISTTRIRSGKVDADGRVSKGGGAGHP